MAALQNRLEVADGGGGPTAIRFTALLQSGSSEHVYSVLEQGSQDGTERRAACITTGTPAVRPPARMREPLAQLGRTGDTGGRVGRAQRHVLLKVYASCIDGQDEAAKRRIELALTDDHLGDIA